jgi:hypothetical protein
VDELTVLYRPIGSAEYALLVRSGFREFPPQLPDQPVFYPVTDEASAAQVAREWNARDAASGYVGSVTRFALRTEFLARYPLRKVGGSLHREYSIPAEHLPELNRNIVGPIEVVAEFRPERG